MRPRILPQDLPLGAIRGPDGRPLKNRYGQLITHNEPIRDGEAFVRRVIDDVLGDWGMFVTNDEYDDLVLDLLEVGLDLERKFTPERSPSFAGYARWIIGKRVADHGPRKLLGRTGLRSAERLHAELDERTHQGTRPWEAVTAIESDVDSDRGTDDGRLQRDRARTTTWAHTILGVRAA